MMTRSFREHVLWNDETETGVDDIHRLKTEFFKEKKTKKLKLLWNIQGTWLCFVALNLYRAQQSLRLSRHPGAKQYRSRVLQQDNDPKNS